MDCVKVQRMCEFPLKIRKEMNDPDNDSGKESRRHDQSDIIAIENVLAWKLSVVELHSDTIKPSKQSNGQY